MNMTQLIDLLIETTMTVSMFPGQQYTIENLIASPILGLLVSFSDEDRSLKAQARVRSILCRTLVRESSGDCRNLLKFDDWIHVMS